MSVHKITPWNMQQDQNINFIKKLQNLSNFSSKTNLSQNKYRNTKIQFTFNVGQKLKKLEKINDGILSANVSQKNFNKTNRSEYRVTKLIFNQKGTQSYKIQPEGQSKRKLLKMSSAKKFHKSPFQFSNHRLKQLSTDTKKSRKQIYYNLTEMNSPLNDLVKKKCHTEVCIENNGNKIIDNLHKQQNKQYKKQNQFMSRQLFIERKIFMLQSGNRTQKFSQSKEEISSKKNLRKCRNIIEQICYAEKAYSRQQRKQEQNI